MTLAQLLLRAAEAHPGRPAVWSSTGELTYAELCDRALRLANALVEHGIEPGDRVVIALPKDITLPVAIFGTLLAGGAYVPVDYLTPPARTHTIVTDAEPVAVVSGSRRSPALHWLGPDGNTQVRTSLDRVQQLDPLRTPVDVPDSALAYILYTSGSTGRPKGVAHTNSSALAFVKWAADAVALDEHDVLSQHASPAFDLSVFDFFCAAKAAARLALVPDSTFGRVASLCRFIVATGVTVWYSVPSALLKSVAALEDSALRQVIFAGEEIPVGPLRTFRQHLPPSCRIANWYGPTETNVCIYHDVTAQDLDGPIPIGRPCPYATTKIADGELLVAGESLMTGYWRMPDATSRVLATAPDGRTYYATGDLVSQDAGGLTFRGRVDRMLKVRGYRVQPEEIEHALEQRAEIEEAAVVKHRRDGVDVLVAVVRLAGGHTLAPDAVLDHCRRLLPAYMVPDTVLAVAELPRGSRGKVDYDAVPGVK